MTSTIVFNIIFLLPQSLLDLPNPSKLVYLGVGALGGRYCGQHECDGVPEVDAFLEKLSQPLNGGCKVSSYDDEVKVIFCNM